VRAKAQRATATNSGDAAIGGTSQSSSSSAAGMSFAQGAAAMSPAGTPSESLMLRREPGASPHSADSPEAETGAHSSAKELAGKSGMVSSDSGTQLLSAPDMESNSLASLAQGSPLAFGRAKGDYLEVTAWPGREPTKGWVHFLDAKVQPGLDRADKDKDGDTDHAELGVGYSKIRGKAFIGEPSIDDIKQGSLGDCYLITALGALTTSPGGRKTLREMVSPGGEANTYKVTFTEFVRGMPGPKRAVVVDTWIPSSSGMFHYALKGKAISEESLKTTPLWPVIIEKAYASWKGELVPGKQGYDAIEGGHASQAASEMTGLPSDTVRVTRFRDDADLLAAIKGAVDSGDAVTASSLHKAPREFASSFTGSGNRYRSDPEGAKVVKGSVRIADEASEPIAPKVWDDNKGKLTSRPAGPERNEATGTVDYKDAEFVVEYPKGAAPASADDLALEYKAYGKISASPLVYGRHAYIVRGVEGDRIDVFNPWGKLHPGLVDVATFRKLFRQLSTSPTDLE